MYLVQTVKKIVSPTKKAEGNTMFRSSRVSNDGSGKRANEGVGGRLSGGQDIQHNNHNDGNGNIGYETRELNAMKEMMEWYKGRSEENAAEVARLQLQLERRQSGQGGVGKNKQLLWATAAEDVSNVVALKESTAQMIWPQNKFLNFTGRWMQYDTDNPHPFAAFVMKQVVIPDSFVGSTNDYFRNVALPKVGAKLSTLRGNCIGRCGKAFKGK